MYAELDNKKSSFYIFILNACKQIGQDYEDVHKYNALKLVLNCV